MIGGIYQLRSKKSRLVSESAFWCFFWVMLNSQDIDLIKINKFDFA